MRICEISGKRTITGNLRSKSLRAVKRDFQVNLHKKEYKIHNFKVKLRLSTYALRTIKKYGGLEPFLLKKNLLTFSNKVKTLRKNILKISS